MSSLANRFMRYVQIDTQSDPHSHTFPSTQKQKNLSELLAKELLGLGLKMRMRMNLVMCMLPFPLIRIKTYR